jgi:hypothetical protein
MKIPTVVVVKRDTDSVEPPPPVSKKVESTHSSRHVVDQRQGRRTSEYRNSLEEMRAFIAYESSPIVAEGTPYAHVQHHRITVLCHLDCCCSRQ